LKDDSLLLLLLLLLLLFGVPAGVAAWGCFLDTISLVLHLTLPAADQTLLQVGERCCAPAHTHHHMRFK
jgi:hypothetical protein